MSRGSYEASSHDIFLCAQGELLDCTAFCRSLALSLSLSLSLSFSLSLSLVPASLWLFQTSIIMLCCFIMCNDYEP